MAASGPAGPDRAKNLLWAAGRLADYGIGIGLDPVPEVLLHPSVIERFTAHAPGLSGVTRRTLRTNLRFLARAVVPHLDPADAPLPRERAKAPYDPAEISGYLALAAAQPTPARRMRAAGLVCLGAGAGLIRADLRAVRGTDIIARSGGVIVTARGNSQQRDLATAAIHRQQVPAIPGCLDRALGSQARAWAAEFGPCGVRVNAVAPRPTRSPMNDGFGDMADHIAALAVGGRLANPEELEVALAPSGCTRLELSR